MENKRKKKNVVCMIRACYVILFILLLMAVSGKWVEAKNKKETLMTLKEISNVAVNIQFDVEEPLAYFVSPDGTKYTKRNAKQYRMTFESGKNFICYYIRDAQPGKWRIVYDKKKNKKLDIHFSDFVDTLKIDSLSFEKQKNELLPVNFKCSYPSNENFQYEIYAVTLKKGKECGSKLLGSGSAETNEKCQETLDLTSLNTFNKYYIKLEVYMDVYGLETQDQKITDMSFSYKQKDSMPPMSECKFCVDVFGKQLNVDWSDCNVTADKYIVAIFDKENTQDPLFYQTLNSESCSTMFQIDTEVDQLRAQISYQNNGLTSEIFETYIPLKKNKYYVQFDTEEITNSKQLKISYKVPKRTEMRFFINEIEQKKTVEGESIISLNLQENQNDCYLYYNTNTNITYMLHRIVSVDSIAPNFTFLEKYSGIKTYDKTFKIVGNTETDATLYINDKEFPIDSAGYFSVGLDLGYGNNIFEVKVRDVAGNIAKQSISITRLTDSSLLQKINFQGFSKLWITIGVFLGTLFIGIFLLILYDKKMKKNPKQPRRNLCIVHCSMLLIALIGSIIMEVFVVRKSILYGKMIYTRAYYSLVKESVEKAYEATQYFRFCIILSMILLVFALLIFLGIKRCIRKIKNSKIVYCKFCGSERNVTDQFCGFCGKKE